jgi:type II secretory pathway component HofQ
LINLHRAILRQAQDERYGRDYRLLPALLAVVLLAGCLSNPAIRDSREMLAAGQTDAAILRLAEASRLDPSDNELRGVYHRQRELAASRLLASADSARAAGKAAEAEALYRRVQRIDEHNPRVVSGFAALAAESRHTRLIKGRRGRRWQRTTPRWPNATRAPCSPKRPAWPPRADCCRLCRTARRRPTPGR